MFTEYFKSFFKGCEVVTFYLTIQSFSQFSKNIYSFTNSESVVWEMWKCKLPTEMFKI